MIHLSVHKLFQLSEIQLPETPQKYKQKSEQEVKSSAHSGHKAEMSIALNPVTRQKHKYLQTYLLHCLAKVRVMRVETHVLREI